MKIVKNVGHAGVGDKDIDCAFIRLNGEYPGDNKFAMNTICKELVFCIEGSGTLEMKFGNKYRFEKFDAIVLEPGEIYRFSESHCGLVVVCDPAWDPNQQKIVE